MFELQKKTFLKKQDKSKKGCIDSEIIALVKKINRHPDYYTTSSCAGRIVLYIPRKKPETKWLFVSHKPIALNELRNINLKEEMVWLRQEGMILHVACRTLKSAQTLVNTARSVGFKRTGIQSTGAKIMVEIASSEIMEFPIAENRRWLVDDDYLKRALSEANEKLKRNKEKTIRLFNAF